MASMNSTIDGLGFEEMGQPGSQVADIWVTGSIVTETYVSGPILYATVISGLNVSAGSITDHRGLIRPVEIENATVLQGYKVKAGSVLIGPEYASGLVNFATPFADANYFMTMSARTLTNPYLYQVTDFSGLVIMPSGTRRASGCWIYGGSNTVVDWIAVGL